MFPHIHVVTLYPRVVTRDPRVVTLELRLDLKVLRRVNQYLFNLV